MKVYNVSLIFLLIFLLHLSIHVMDTSQPLQQREEGLYELVTRVEQITNSKTEIAQMLYLSNIISSNNFTNSFSPQQRLVTKGL